MSAPTDQRDQPASAAEQQALARRGLIPRRCVFCLRVGLLERDAEPICPACIVKRAAMR